MKTPNDKKTQQPKLKKAAAPDDSQTQAEAPADKVFRPSKIPKLEACIQFEEDPTPTVYTQRGTDKHHSIAQVLLGELRVAHIKDKETRNDVVWIREQLQARGLMLYRVEWEIPLWIDNKVVWGCTVDYLGFDKEDVLWVVDFKTGDKRDYTGQLCAYCKAAMSELKRTDCVMLTLFIDLREAEEFDVSLVDAVQRTDSLYHAWLSRGVIGHTICDYCDMCAKRSRCPRWLEQAELAMIDVPEIRPMQIWDIDVVKRDPVQLGQFYGAYKRLEKLVIDWDLKGAVLEFLLNGQEVPGFIKVKDKSQRYADIEQMLVDDCQLLRKLVMELGTAKVAEIFRISVSKLEENWKDWYPGEECPVSITTVTPMTYHAQIAPPKGRGAARMAREERAK